MVIQRCIQLTLDDSSEIAFESVQDTMHDILVGLSMADEADEHYYEG